MNQQGKYGPKDRKHAVQINGCGADGSRRSQERTSDMLSQSGIPNGRLALPVVPFAGTNAGISIVSTQIPVAGQHGKMDILIQKPNEIDAAADRPSGSSARVKPIDANQYTISLRNCFAPNRLRYRLPSRKTAMFRKPHTTKGRYYRTSNGLSKRVLLPRHKCERKCVANGFVAVPCSIDLVAFPKSHWWRRGHITKANMAALTK